MTTISQTLEAAFRAAFLELKFSANTPVLLADATKPEFGDFQVNGIMGAAKIAKINPRELAQQIISKVNLGPMVEKLEIAGPGFINITLNNEYLAQYVLNLNSNNNYGIDYLQHKSQTVVVDLSSPNLAKEMHVGHLRSTVIGDALARMFEYMGDTVIRQNHVGDWGTQFGMLLAYLEMYTQEPHNFSDASNLIDMKDAHFSVNDLERFYQNAKKRFDEDPSFADRARQLVVKLQQKSSDVLTLWQKFREESLNHCQKVYDQLKVKLSVNNVCGESFYEPYLPQIVDILQAKEVIIESEGAKCVFFAPGELSGKEDTPFIVQKKDGGYLYSTTDLAAINYRVHNLHADRIIYVVDARQAFHFKQLFIVAKKAQLVTQNTKLEHVMFGTMMNEDGRPFKTRDGGTVKLINLVDEAIIKAKNIVTKRNPNWSSAEQDNLAKILAIDAIKYADLAKNRNSDYIFSFDSMLAFEGNTAPYLLYAYTRIQSILRKAQESEIEVQPTLVISEMIEHKLALHLTKFADVLNIATNDCYPHYICQYLYDLAGLFMQFYESCSILSADTRQKLHSRLYLADLTAKILKLGLNDLLGIEVIDGMRM
ncbi:MAG: arginine--tRNA ligase [Burkholderiales bacterium]|nr:arginine--tRNA ligase [Burkholderiales bacterium]